MSHTKTHVARALGVMSLLISVLAFGGSALATAASAQTTAPACSANMVGYEGTASLSNSNATPSPGEVVHIIGTGFPPNSSVPVLANGTLIGTAVTDAAGGFDLTWTVPATATAGTTYEFTADCGTITPHTSIQVSAVTATTSVPTGNLPSTGSSSTMPLLASGVAMVVLGGLILLATRKRTQRAGQAA